MSEGKFFTIVFKGDIRKLPFNPMNAETIFGEVFSSAVGNIIADKDKVENAEYVMSLIQDAMGNYYIRDEAKP